MATNSSSKDSTSTQGSCAGKQPLGPRLSIQREAIFNLLNQLAIENETYFRQCHPSNYNTRIADICEEITSSINLIKDMVKRIQIISHKCDFDENTPGNGFRSLVCVSDMVLLRLVSLLRICSENRFMLMFRLSHYCKELEAFGAIIRFLILTFQQVIVMLDSLAEGSLFPPLEGDYQKYNVLLKSIESLDATCFYGRPIGFQFCPSVTRIFRVIGLVLATYSLSWETSAAWGSLLNSGKLLINPEQRAKRIIKVTREADIGFCRGFWNLSELPMPKLFCPAMAICESREIEPSGPIQLETKDGGVVLIQEPSSHTGVRPVSIKILSYSQRAGLSTYSSPTNLPPSSSIVIHCHGGGYVATSSKSHETYLRSWAKSLNVPIVSIDYSLAPENPYPRPTEEVLYVYAWMLKNPEKFGWTGEKICMVGDSAGGNLITSVCLRLIELNAARLPDGIVPIYTPFLFQYLPSPSRILSFMDPLLHMGVVIRCAAAYTGLYSDEELDRNCSFRSVPVSSNNANGHRSLADYVDQVQKAQRDNLLDFTQGSQSIVSLINLSFLNSSDAAKNGTADRSLNIPDPNLSTTNSVGNENIERDTVENLPISDQKILLNGAVEVVENKTKDNAGGAQSGAAENGEEDDNMEEDESDQDIQSVRVDADPTHICLYSSNFDQTLINYLQLHPLTRNSVQEIIETNGIQHPTINFDSDEVFDNDAMVSDSNAPQSKVSFDLPTNGSFVAEMEDIPIPQESCVTPNEKVKEASSANTAASNPLSSAGHTPYYKSANREKDFLGVDLGDTNTTRSSVGSASVGSYKTPLSRNKGRSLSQSLADTAALAMGHTLDNISDWFDTPTKEPLGASDKKKLTRATTMSTQKAAKLHQEESKSHESHFTELLKLKLPRDYLMSPMYAPDEILRKLPPIRFVACHLDPLLDDTIMFAKRVRRAGGNVVSVDLLDSLPHGFLNFAPMSYECREGANFCLHRIKDTLGL